MQRRDLVVELIPAFIESPRPALPDHPRGQRRIYPGGCLWLRARQVCRKLEIVERLAGVAVGGVGDQIAGPVFHGHTRRAQTALAVVDGPIDDASYGIPVQRLEHVDAGPGEQRRVDFEGGVLRGGADEDHGAVLHVGQEGVLLGLVEAVHLVHEEHRAAAGGLSMHARPVHRLANVLDPRQHRRQGQKLGLAVGRHQPPQGGLTGAGRTPENHGVGVARVQRAAQRSVRPEQRLLAFHLV